MKTAAPKQRIARGRRLPKRAVISKKLPAKTKASAIVSPDESDEFDWVFDRHDLRYNQPVLPPDVDFKEHLLNLGDVRCNARSPCFKVMSFR